MSLEFLIRQMKAIPLAPDLEVRQRLSVGVLVKALTLEPSDSLPQRQLLLRLLARNGDLSWEEPEMEKKK